MQAVALSGCIIYKARRAVPQGNSRSGSLCPRTLYANSDSSLGVHASKEVKFNEDPYFFAALYAALYEAQPQL